MERNKNLAVLVERNSGSNSTISLTTKFAIKKIIKKKERSAPLMFIRVSMILCRSLRLRNIHLPSAEEGTLTISCANEIEIITISITTRTGDTQELSLDIPGMVSKEHTAKFPFGPGRYQITIHINPNVVYQYEITVIRQSGKIEITNCRPI